MNRDGGAESVPPGIAAIMAAIRGEIAGDTTAVAPLVPDSDADASDPAAPLLPAAPRASRAGPASDGATPALPTTVDADVRALLAPLLKAWLDAHLPEMVEAATRAEIRRLTGLID